MSKSTKEEDAVHQQIGLIKVFGVAFSSSAVFLVFKVINATIFFQSQLRSFSDEFTSAFLIGVKKIEDCPESYEGLFEFICRDLNREFDRELASLADISSDTWFAFFNFLMIECVPIIFATVAGAAVWSLMHNRPDGKLLRLFDYMLYCATYLVGLLFCLFMTLSFFLINSHFQAFKDWTWIPALFGFILGFGILQAIWENTPLGHLMQRNEKGIDLTNSAEKSNLNE
jgi:hypothetical protein